MKPATHIIKRKGEGTNHSTAVYPSDKKGCNFHVRQGSDGFHFKSLESVKKFAGKSFEVVEVGSKTFTLPRNNSEYPVQTSKNGWHVLSNGEKVLGRKKAIAGQNKLDGNG